MYDPQSYRRIRRSRDSWRAWTLTLAAVLFIVVCGLISFGWS